MPKLATRIPKYRAHKASGQAVVTIDGRDVYLGTFNSPESHEAYRRAINDLLHRRSADAIERPDPMPAERRQQSILVAEVLEAFWEHARTYYRRADGTHTSELSSFSHALEPLSSLYGATPVGQFGANALRAVRERFIAKGWCRRTINDQVSRIRSVFKWAEGREMVPRGTHRHLQTVEALLWGRSDAPESEPVEPVADEVVEATLPHVSPVVADMIRLQRLTGMRPGELVIMRGCDLDTRADVWVYKPSNHKQRWRGQDRLVPLSAAAQDIVARNLKANPQDFLFSPAASDQWHRDRRSAERKTPPGQGNRPGTNRTGRRAEQLNDRFTVDSYRRAITRACLRAFPLPAELRRQKIRGRKDHWEKNAEWARRLGEKRWAAVQQWQRDHHWHPHQLRHQFATVNLPAVGPEVTRLMLGHRDRRMLDIYAAADRKAVMEAVRSGKIG